MRSTAKAVRTGIIAALMGVVACSATTSSLPPDGLLPLGTWGGDNAGMIVGDTAMHLHVGCTFGDVSGRVAVGGNGSFDVQGSYMLRAFPIARGPTVPARFVGKVDGAKATVTVTVNDTVEKKTVVLGPVVVTFGIDPKMGPCPICRRPIRTSTVFPIRARDIEHSALWWEQIVRNVLRVRRELFHEEHLNV